MRTPNLRTVGVVHYLKSNLINGNLHAYAIYNGKIKKTGCERSINCSVRDWRAGNRIGLSFSVEKSGTLEEMVDGVSLMLSVSWRLGFS